MKCRRAVLVIHGGAGTVARSQLDGPREQRYHDALRRILEAGRALLGEGASALDVVTEAVRQLEDCPLFNAGHGAHLAHNEVARDRNRKPADQDETKDCRPDPALERH